MWSLTFIVLALLHCDASGLGIRIRRNCNYDTDCEENSYCQNQKMCECKSGFNLYTHPNTRDELCLRGQLNQGDECLVDEQCQVKMGLAAECSTIHDCQCREGAHYIENTGRCYNTSKIGESCHTSDYCHIEQPRVILTCDRGTCACPRGHHGNREGTQCIASVRLGDTCSLDEQCITTNSRCYEVCRCDMHHIENANMTLCLPDAERLGDACQESVQCSKTLSHSGCVQGLCQCLELYHPGAQGHKCWKTAYVGEPCEHDDECMPTSQWNTTVNLDLAKCISRQCRCTRGSPVDGTCKDSASIMPNPERMIVVLSTMILASMNHLLC